MTALLPREPLPPLSAPPFGTGRDGKPIKAISGKLIAGSIRHLWDLLAERVRKEAGSGLSEKEIDARVARVKSETLERLVTTLNGRILDPRYRISGEMLLSEGNSYSREFEFHVVTLCRDLSGDEDFIVRRGEKIVPPAVVAVFRPLGIRQSYNFLPRATQKFLDTDVRVVEIRGRSATIRWYAGSQVEEIPSNLRQAWFEWSCPAYKTTYAAIPKLLEGLPVATSEDLKCQIRGDDYCEWRFTWETPPPRGGLRLAAGAAGSAALLALGASPLPLHDWASVLAPVPLVAGFVSRHLLLLRHAREELDALLAEQRETAEQQVDRAQIAHGQLQQSNLALTTKIAELTALQEVSHAVSATLDLDEILVRSLDAVIRHLNYDRAVFLLVDERDGTLRAARTAGYRPDEAVRVGRVQVAIDDPRSLLAGALRDRRPILVKDFERSDDEETKEIARAVRGTSFLAAPLLARGRALGLLAVDNPDSRRPLLESELPLLSSVAGALAVAIENARLYREIEEQNRTLERRVAERTAELAEATAAAQDANRAKSRFLANTSHELRTPLNAVIGYSEMLLETAEERGDMASEADLRKIQNAGRYLLGLINDILDLSKIEAGRMEIVTEPFDLGAIVRETTATVRPLLEKNRNDLRLEIPDGPHPAVTDATKVRQILLNLLGNATKFTSNGRVGVSIARDGHGDGPARFAVRVSDTGIGMSPEQVAGLFRIFAQGDASTNRLFGGTGLGLALSRNLARLLGGDVTAESEAGRGSVFTLTLPAEPPTAARAGRQESSGSRAAAASG